MLELKPIPNGRSSRTAFEKKQPRRLLLALFLLVIALAGVLIKDWDFWFGDGRLEDADVTYSETAQAATTKSASAVSTPSLPAPAKRLMPAVSSTENPAPTAKPAVSTTRTVLPPLDVEVIAGDTHRNLRPGNNATQLEISNAATAARQGSGMEVATNAADRAPLSGASLQGPTTSLDATYPLLAQQMKVQGSVVLQAIVGADGIIENLHVLSGPAILTSAAQQAVRQWRFKPYIQNGQPVETKATITVNFTIRVADNTPTPVLQSQAGGF